MESPLSNSVFYGDLLLFEFLLVLHHLTRAILLKYYNLLRSRDIVFFRGSSTFRELFEEEIITIAQPLNGFGLHSICDRVFNILKLNLESSES